MTPSDDTALADVLAKCRHVLLDFDGPICSIFGGLPAHSVADHLRGILTRQAVEIPADVDKTDDPFDVLKFAATVTGDLAGVVEAEHREMELRAIRSATPTPHAAEVITACPRSHRSVGVVSNNSQDAVTQYLKDHGLASEVSPIIGRTQPDPRLLKPHPALVLRAISELHSDPFEAVLVGDSTSDIEAARAAGIHSIGYANKPGKHQRLAAADADAVITDMAELATHLQKQPRTAPRDLGR